MKWKQVVINLRRRHHTSRTVIGCDLNVSLALSLEGLRSTRIDPNVNGASARWREAIAEWMHSLRLLALCTFDHDLTPSQAEWDRTSSWTLKFKEGRPLSIGLFTGF